ncbi:Neuropeptide-Like Protein [Caenorhabditis elegans]|uniref:Neuropeptide-Like Protein n=1 Tax=Caenorhabditis elegans TaxID=6239 RepID=B3WFV5_CAEEL|nr:Neuropeptide-Like Protein [Caenorhabditis elegans]CAQ76494.2 Neuropeptide-Like Protein [Caenorhabditis elegans]|eukprot:NP_001129907.2 Neuropeptide-Like Protein [Caenorhabditis elegans]
MISKCSVMGLLLLLFVHITTAQFETHFDDAQVYWPSQYKRSGPSSASEGEAYAFPGLRGLRGKRDPTYHKRVPMMSLKGLRGKRARIFDGQEEQ